MCLVSRLKPAKLHILTLSHCSPQRVKLQGPNGLIFNATLVVSLLTFDIKIICCHPWHESRYLTCAVSECTRSLHCTIDCGLSACGGPAHQYRSNLKRLCIFYYQSEHPVSCLCG